MSRFTYIYAVSLLVILGLMLTACSSNPVTSPQQGASPVREASGPTEPVPTPSPLPEPEPTTEPSPSPSPSTPALGSGRFSLSPEQDSGIPGVPAGITEDGAPFRGFPEAEVTMVEYSDFQCPFCLRHVQQTQPQLNEQYIATGKVKHVYKNFPLRNIHPLAEPAAQAALCAGVQGKFWPMHDVLFERQNRWANQEDAAPIFRQFAEELGLDMEAFDACWKAQPFKEHIQREVEEGVARGVSGTPAFFINDWFISGAQSLDTFQSVIEKALAGERPTPTPTLSYADLHPFEANPDTPGRTYMGDAFTGSADAPVVILEVSDFLCPYCRRHHTEVWPEFKQKYVETGKVRVVFKHLLGHSNSEPPAEAAECAGNQGQFFPYADVLYARVDEWKGLNGDELVDTFVTYAQELGLDVEAFRTCLEGHEMQEKVRQDHRTVLQANVRGTPTFIVIVNGQALGRIPGFISLEQWDDVMRQVEEAMQQ